MGFNGEKYFLVDRECPGIGKGTMTKELLLQMRDKAKNHNNSQILSSSILPILNSLIMANMYKRSQEAMDSLSEEDRKKLEEMLSKEKEEDSVSSEDSKEEDSVSSEDSKEEDSTSSKE